MSIYRTRNGDLSLNSIKNSITEILPNKSADSIERNKFEQSQNASIVKALNNIESPVKEKHIRNIILGTCYEKSALPFWYMSLKLQPHGNAIICWKFNYVLHKLLRDGYSSTVDDSFRFVATLDDLAKSWVHLKQGYGTMLFHYCSFLSFKIKFHKKNQLIPCNLVIDDKDLANIAGNDVNNYFQMCCDFFDYAEEIIGLQNAVFVTMDRSRSNSMTESGQCKLAPLVLCVQESNQLYDFCVKFLFKLHENLPSEILEGHRTRFLNLFKQLSKFYECCKNLQYFKNLITIPDLPPNPPNFRHKSDFNSYSKPVMVVVEQPVNDSSLINDEDSVLVDFSDNQLNALNTSSSSSSNNDTNSIQMQQLQQQQFMYSQQLLQEIERLRAELDRLTMENEFERRALRERIKLLEDELLLSKTELEQQKIKSQNLEDKLKIVNENEKARADLDNLEKKAVSSEEKFNKMKELYTKLKDQHVVLLRQEADVRKQQSSLAEQCEHANKMKKELEKRLEEAIEEKTKTEANLQAKSTEYQLLKSESEKNQASQIAITQTSQDQLKTQRDQMQKMQSELEEASKKISEIETGKKDLQDKCTNLLLNSINLESELNKLKTNSSDLTEKLDELTAQKELAEKEHLSNLKNLKELVFASTLKRCIAANKSSLHLFEDPVLLNCKSGSEYLLNRMQPFSEHLTQMLNFYEKFIQTHSDSDYSMLLNDVNTFSTYVTDCVINGKITSLTAADLDQGEQLAEFCRQFGQSSISLLEKLELKKSLSNDQDEKELIELGDKITKILYELLPKVHDINKQEIGDLIDQEMHNTSEAIEAAVAKLEALLNKSREQDTGVKLEVNDKILDNCTGLMKAIKILIMKAKELQKEIVVQGRGASTTKEFYAKNHKWTEGLVTAAKLVGLSANVLIEKADKLVNGDGKLEEIIVCSNEIAASTAQLVVASNVKADRESKNRIALVEAKKNVSNATASLVASAKSCSQIIDDQTSMDFSNLSLHQTKRLEMESQVKVLELEKLLETEKKKLYNLRKQHYHQSSNEN